MCLSGHCEEQPLPRSHGVQYWERMPSLGDRVVCQRLGSFWTIWRNSLTNYWQEKFRNMALKIHGRSSHKLGLEYQTIESLHALQPCSLILSGIRCLNAELVCSASAPWQGQCLSQTELEDLEQSRVFGKGYGETLFPRTFPAPLLMVLSYTRLTTNRH